MTLTDEVIKAMAMKVRAMDLQATRHITRVKALRSVAAQHGVVLPLGQARNYMTFLEYIIGERQ